MKVRKIQLERNRVKGEKNNKIEKKREYIERNEIIEMIWIIYQLLPPTPIFLALQ